MLLQEELQSVRWREKATVEACSWLPTPIIQTHSHIHSDVAQLSMPQDALSHASVCIQYVCACVSICMFHVNGYPVRVWVRVQFDYIQCVWLCVNLCNDCTVVNKQKQALALMKSCCHLFCRSVTIRAPCGSSDRLFFCITLNKRLQCINLTLLGETKGLLIQYNNGAKKMETHYCHML